MTGLPAKKRPDEFGFTVFNHQQAPQGAGYVLKFDTYSAFLEEESRTVKHKKKAKLVLHSRTVDARRRHVDLRSLEAWGVDADATGTVRPDAFLARLEEADIAYIYQERDGRGDGGALRYHLVIALAEPHFWADETKAVAGVREWRGRMGCLRRWLDSQTGNRHDKSFDNIGQGMKPYTRRPEDVNTTVTHRAFMGANALDLGALLVEIGYAPETHASVRKREVDEGALKAFGHLIKSEAPKRLGGWYIQCPADHGDDHDSKTWLRPDGTVKCLAGRCINKPQSYFKDLLAGKAREVLRDARLEAARARLERRGQAGQVPLDQAAGAIGVALAGVDPLSTDGHVVRVTPGAGKTYATAGFLAEYTAPLGAADGEEPVDGGRTAVLAFPTNALLREVSRGVTVPHRVHTGVLGVVNDDGTPACLKWRVANEVQAAGGNVHKLLCARCEHKEGCPARTLASRGAGSLWLTNHTLLPSVVRDLRARGRVPLVVWDESPEMVGASLLTWSDLVKLRARLLADASPTGRADVWGALTHYPVWSDAETAGKLFACDLLLSARPRDGTGVVDVDLDAVVADFGATPASRARLRSLRSRLGLPVLGPTAALTLLEVRETLASAAAGGGGDRTAYDQLPPREQAAHSAAWRVGGLAESALAFGARVRAGAPGLEVTALTPAGRLWGEVGGVVLDATASRTLLAATKGAGVGPGGRAVVRVTDLGVRDAPGVARTWVYCEGLSRTSLKEVPAPALASVVADIRRRFAEGEAAGERQKWVVFLYKDTLEREEVAALKALGDGSSVSLAYFGNVRGYNNYYRERYTHFVTVGDPVSNLGTLESVASYLNVEVDALAAEGAAGELTQAHGRARDVREAVVEGDTRTHIHYGKQLPFGWVKGNTSAEVLEAVSESGGG
jgi:hypothetical protein